MSKKLTNSINHLSTPLMKPVWMSAKGLIVLATVLMCCLGITPKAAAQTFEATCFVNPDIVKLCYTANGKKIVSNYPAKINGAKHQINIPAAEWYNVQMSEYSWLEMAFSDKNEDYVYPFVIFKDKEMRDNFVNRRDADGVLPWSALAAYNNAGQLIEAAPFRYLDDEGQRSRAYHTDNDNLFVLTKIAALRGDNEGYLVMERMPRKKQAIGINVKVAPIKLNYDRSYYETIDGNVCVEIDVTYTNSAPYPVNVIPTYPALEKASDPQLANLQLMYDTYLNSYETNSITQGMYLVPHESRTFKFVMKLQDLSGNKPKALTSKGIFSVVAGAVDATLSPYVVKNSGSQLDAAFYYDINSYDKTILRGEPNVSSSGAIDLPATTPAFALLDYYPKYVERGSGNEIITLVLQRPEELGSVKIKHIPSDTEVPIPLNWVQPTGTPGIYTLSLWNYLYPGDGQYKLTVLPSRVGIYDYPNYFFDAYRSIVATLVPAPVSKISVGQHKTNRTIKTFLGRDVDDNHNLLFEMTDANGSLSDGRIDGDDYTFLSSGLIINGMLKMAGVKMHWKNSGTSASLKIAAGETGQPQLSFKQGNTIYPILKDNITISLNSNQLYDTNPPKEYSKGIEYFGHKGVMLNFNGARDLAIFDAPPIAFSEGIFLYNKKWPNNIYEHFLSLNGGVTLDNFFGGISSSFVELDVNLYDFRLDATGFHGDLKADAHGFIGLKDPFGLSKTGANMDLDINTLPEAKPRYVKVSGSADVGPIDGLDCEFEFREVKLSNGTTPWLPETLKLYLGIPIPVPPLPLEISQYGGHINGIAGTAEIIDGWISGKKFNNLPTFNFGTTAGISLSGELAKFSGATNLGCTLIGFTEGKLEVFGVPILNDMHATFGFENTGRTLTAKVSGKTVDIPLLDVGGSIGGSVELLNVFKGSVEGKLRFTPSKMDDYMNDMQKIVDVINAAVTADKTCKELDNDLTAKTNILFYEQPHYNYNTFRYTLAVGAQNKLSSMNLSVPNFTKTAIDFYTTKKNIIPKTVESFKNIREQFSNKKSPDAMLNALTNTQIDGTSLYDIFTMLVEAEIKGELTMGIPKGLPFSGDIIKAEAGVNLEKMWGKGWVGKKIDIDLPFGWSVNADIGVSAYIEHYFKNAETNWGTSFRSAQEYNAGYPVYGNAFTATTTDNNGDTQTSRFRMPNLMPMVKDAGLRSFSGEFGNTKTQTMLDVQRSFLALVRSKNPGTGLKLTSEDGIVARYTAETLDWKPVDGTDYWEATIFFSLPDKDEALALGATPQQAADAAALNLAGLWTVTTCNSNVTAPDAAGLIDCDFFYYEKDAAIENFAYTYNNALDNVSWTNSNLSETGSYRVKFALVNTANEANIYPIAATQAWAASEPLTSCTIAKDKLNNMESLPSGTYKLQATLEKYDGLLEYEGSLSGIEAWVEQHTVTSAAFTHVNSLEPAAPGNVTATAENGIATVTWTAPADMTGINGYFVNIINGEGHHIAQMKVEAGETSVSIVAAGFDPKSKSQASLMYYNPYTFTVSSFNEFTVNGGTAEEPTSAPGYRQSVPVASNELTVPYPERPVINMLARKVEDKIKLFAGYSEPQDLGNLLVVANSGHSLEISCTEILTAVALQVSEEMRAFQQANSSNSEPTFTDMSSIVQQDASTVKIPLDGFSEEGIYRISLRLAKGDAYNVYNFKLEIDNTPPELTVSEPQQNEAGEWSISGITEAGVELSFNGTDISSLIPNGTFTIPVDGNLSHLNFQAVDAAGNVTLVIAELNGVAELPDGDNTTAVVIDFEHKLLKVGDHFTPAVRVEREGALVTPEEGTIVWSTFQGGNCITLDNETGKVTAQVPGEVVLHATYRGVLKSVATITIADEFPVNDLYVSKVTSETSVKISFTEPLNATGKAMEYSIEIPVNGEITGGWTSISANFDNSGNATVSGIPANKTAYFRMYVTGGINEGYSNAAGRLRQISNEVTVIFDPQNGEDLIFQTEEKGGTITAPAEPERYGFDFAGWYIEPACKNKWNFATDIVTSDTTLYAKWTEIVGVYKVKIDENNFILYPNPATNQVTLGGLQGGEIIIISDIKGQNLLTIKAANNSEILSISHLSQGIYLVRIVREGTNSVLKLVVK